jgi:hypothetical protein
MTAEELQHTLLSSKAAILLLSANLFERDKRANNTHTFVIRKYVKVELSGREADRPLITPVFNLPRLLRRMERQSKPLIALTIDGITAPPKAPASGLTDLVDMVKSVIQVSSHSDAIDSLINRLQPSAVESIKTARIEAMVSSSSYSNTCPSCRLLEAKVAALEKENASLKAKRGEWSMGCEQSKVSPEPGTSSSAAPPVKTSPPQASDSIIATKTPDGATSSSPVKAPIMTLPTASKKTLPASSSAPPEAVINVDARKTSRQKVSALPQLTSV